MQIRIRKTCSPDGGTQASADETGHMAPPSGPRGNVSLGPFQAPAGPCPTELAEGTGRVTPPNWKVDRQCRPRDFLSGARWTLARNCLCHLEPNPGTRKLRGIRLRIQPIPERHKSSCNAYLVSLSRRDSNPETQRPPGQNRDISSGLLLQRKHVWWGGTDRLTSDDARRQFRACGGASARLWRSDQEVN
jgi:hypothetical protein